jgi:hypothetical protein
VRASPCTRRAAAFQISAVTTAEKSANNATHNGKHAYPVRSMHATAQMTSDNTSSPRDGRPEAHSLVIDIVDWERTPCGRTQTEVGVALKSSHTFSRRPGSTLGATTHALAEPSIVIREIRPHSATDHTGGLVWSGHGHVSNRTVKRSPLARRGRHDRHDSHDID